MADWPGAGVAAAGSGVGAVGDGVVVAGAEGVGSWVLPLPLFWPSPVPVPLLPFPFALPFWSPGGVDGLGVVLGSVDGSGTTGVTGAVGVAWPSGAVVLGAVVSGAGAAVGG